MKIIVDPGDENQAADALNGVYEKHRQIQPGDVVFDLGAHRGYFSQLALEKIGPQGRVIAFEPHPENFRKLFARCGTYSNFYGIIAGAWDKDAIAELWPAIGNSGGHSFWKADGQEDEPIDCSLVDIGLWIVRSRFKPDFVKIDTELSELRILTSLMRTPYRPEIAAEIHNQEMWDGCTALLKANGYQTMPDTFTNYYLFAWQP